MADDFSTQALLNFDDFTAVEQQLEPTETVNNIPENTEIIETEFLNVPENTELTETKFFDNQEETEVVNTEILNTKVLRNQNEINTSQETNSSDSTVMKIEESTPQKSTQNLEVQSELEKQLHYFKITSKTFYNIEIIKTDDNQIQHTHKHKTEDECLGEFTEWPNKQIPGLPEKYVWEFMFPLKGPDYKTTSKSIEHSIPKSIQNIQAKKVCLNMTSATMMGLPSTPIKNINQINSTMNLSQLSLPTTPTCVTITANESTKLNNTRATVLGLPDSPNKTIREEDENLEFEFVENSKPANPRSITPVPEDILAEFLSTQILSDNCMVYAKCHDNWIYPAFISEKNPTPGQSKYKVRFQDDNTEKSIAKNHILRIHLLPKEVPVFYTNVDNTAKAKNIKNFTFQISFRSCLAFFYILPRPNRRLLFTRKWRPRVCS